MKQHFSFTLAFVGGLFWVQEPLRKQQYPGRSKPFQSRGNTLM
ncbi:hypothetical protein [Roseibium sp.]